MLELTGLRTTFGRVVALDSVDLAVGQGTTTALIGPSGCGKSTLLRVIVRLVVPERGTVRFDDIPVTEQTIADVRSRVGYVIQEGGLFPHMTAHRNITLMASRRGWKPDRIEERVAELVSLTRFPKEALARYPAQLSGGQRQRVSLMRALMLDPDVLLLDEPLGALDPMIRTELQDELKTIFAKLNKTVLLVTHDLAEAAYLAHNIVLMRRGRIIQQGPARELVENPADEFVTQFVTAQRGHAEAIGGSA